MSKFLRISQTDSGTRRIAIMLALTISFAGVNTLLAQTPELRKYFSNIVSIGPDQFGFIVGNNPDQSGVIYFVVPSVDGDLPPMLPKVKHYRGSSVGSARRIETFTLPGSKVYLYELATRQEIPYEKLSFDSFAKSSQAFYSYLDNGKEDSLWFANSTPMTINERLSDHTVQIKVQREDYFFKGMPVVNSRGSVVGLVAEGQANSGMGVFTAVDMMSVGNALYTFSKCRHFSLVQEGSTGTRCDLQEQQRSLEEKEAKKLEAADKQYAIASGPGFAANLNLCGGEPSLTGIGYSLGYNFYIGSDRGAFRVLLKPRYTHAPMRVDEEYYSTSTSYLKVERYRLNTLETPIILEWVTKKQRSSNNFFGLGYTFGYQLPLKYKYSTGIDDNLKLHTVPDSEKLIQKVIVELGFEFDNSRFSLTASYQLTDWHAWDYFIEVDNIVVYPFEATGLQYLQLAFEIDFRLKGRWGIQRRASN